MRRAIYALLLTPVLACSGESKMDASVVTTPDAGMVVSDAGASDAGPPRDGGPTVCDPVANTGCDTAGEECLYHINLRAPQCRVPGQNQHEQQCTPNDQDCPGGFTCLFLMGEANPSCRKVCRISDGTGCENLTGASSAYACSIQIMDESEFGWCAGCPNTCDPLAPTCAANETCGLSNTCGTTCNPAGSAPLNANCMNDACRPGGMCVTLNGVNNDEPRCYEPCDLGAPACSTAGYDCADINQPFGLCVPPQ